MRAQDISYFGDAVGHWEGDTLVVESVGFNDDTWLASGGYFHSYDMKVTERLRREGNDAPLSGYGGRSDGAAAAMGDGR